MSAAGSDRVATAFAGAFRRLEKSAEKGPPDDVYADLGETLFWLHAFAEANGQGKEPVVLAMRWARDHIAHGLIVVAPVAWDDGSALARGMPARRGYEWSPRDAIPTLRQARNKGQIARDDAYDACAVQREMLNVIRTAFRDAGGTI